MIFLEYKTVGIFHAPRRHTNGLSLLCSDELRTQASVSKGTADAGPSTEESNVPVEPARIGDQESTVPTRPPTPWPTQTGTGERVADAGPSAEGSSAQGIGVGSNGSHGIYEA